MSISPFHLTGTVGRSYDVSAGDTRRTKMALRRLGYFKTPDYGLTDLPDDALFGAIEAFQRSQKLAADGVIKPDGPTAAKLGLALEAAVKPTTTAGSPKRTASARSRIPGRASQLLSADPEKDFKHKHSTQVALAPVLPAAAWLAGLLGSGGGAYYLGKEAWKRYEDERRRQEWSPPRRQAVDPLPPLPPSEPPEEEPDNKEEFPAEPPIKDLDLSRPMPEEAGPTIYVFPELPEDEADFGRIIENRGNPRTKAHLDRVRDRLLDANPDWDHIAGGRDRESGEEKPEQHIGGPGAAWGADSRPGSRRADMTFRRPNGKLVIVQTVDVDKDGSIKAHELKAARDIIRAYEGGVEVILIKKDWQMEKVRKRR